jgi:hypothetical protein
MQAAKEKQVAATTRPKPVKKSASKKPAPTKEAEIASPKNTLPAEKKKFSAIASKAKSTRLAAKKAPKAPHVSQAKLIRASGKGSGGV